jgi:membrane protein implicated in regulation of membrane protease activity
VSGDLIPQSELSRPHPRPSPKQIGPCTDIMLIFFYVPVLVFLPVLLIVGIFFLIVPGGFIIVAAAVYWAWMGLTAAGAAALASRHSARVSRRRERPSLASGRPSNRARRELPARTPVLVTAARPSRQSMVSEPRRAQ